MTVSAYKWTILSTERKDITSKMALGISRTQSYISIPPYVFMTYKFVTLQC